MNKPKKSFKQFSAEVKTKAESSTDALHDHLHRALKASGHTAQSIPKQHESGKLPSGNDEKAFGAGVHGWVHPDGTYYHIDQKEGLNSFHFADGAVHHSGSLETMSKHLPKNIIPKHHLAQVASTVGSPRGFVLTSKAPLTNAQQRAIHRGIVSGSYKHLDYELKPHDRKIRGGFKQIEHDESHFEGKLKAVLRQGHPLV